ncbi:MAG: hypothetical protein K9N23_12900 [Akkermansiaceae bacterium]|nr:hypothetical protein [Akkermansiaceae bacterium]MCF7732583.1 hypothetical protein [Akkermansiaceae bacterium]
MKAKILIPRILVGVALVGVGAFSTKFMTSMTTTHVMVAGGLDSYDYDSRLGFAVLLAKAYPKSQLVYWYTDTKASGPFGAILVRLEFDEESKTYGLLAPMNLAYGDVELFIDGRVVDSKSELRFSYKSGENTVDPSGRVYETTPRMWKFKLGNAQSCRIVVTESLRRTEVIVEDSTGNSGSIGKSLDQNRRDDLLRAVGGKVRGVVTVDSSKTRTIVIERTPPLNWTSKYVEK